ncbi:MAG: class I tRNA ligase family protein [Patescibacteria group bacterium]|nr:class I tRNA ligase family protein [Patescibacteria group bacterium]MDE2015097.1 class I tRNA ligase family protein [Patescibacteria group bacterium]MDE2226525.1 class I tRNA ligase family protein [Patescibacteria group bacterium]
MPEEFNLPKEEEKVLKFWNESDIFAKTLAKRKGAKKFIFYEGPPTANGRPGVHHILARAFKDIIPRYKAMRGYLVPRKGGWDTHGLPVEIGVEKQLGLKTKKDIENYGVEAFNKKCRESVWEYKDEWERLTKRMGFWLDLKDPYITYESSYIETLWWIIKRFWTKKLLYKGHKVVPWCVRCGTSLSSHELALGYKETTDDSVYIKFKLKRGQKIGGYFSAGDDTYVLSWTTTPWTLPGNVALAVGKNIKYAVLKKMIDGKIERWIVAEEAVKNNPAIFGSAPDLREIFEGNELIGLSYEPLFEIPALRSPSSYKVYDADFVNTTEGTGVVHTAVMYGEDDYQLGLKVGLPRYHTVDEVGKFTKDVSGFSGLFAKSKETEAGIVEHLKQRGSLLKVLPYKHDYPYCWRCGTPILYYARNSWFVAMSGLRKQLIANNNKINWTPEYVKQGRFGEWLREVKDWNFSRERFWGTPLPIWECKKCNHCEVAGGIDELSKLAGGSRNNYWVMRHGEAKSNAEHFIDSGWSKDNTLTVIGRSLAEKSAKNFLQKLKSSRKKIDVIVSSDIIRTKETAEIAAEALGVKKVVFDKRLREVDLGSMLQGGRDSRYHKLFPTYESKFEGKPEGGESLRDLRSRVWEILQELEKKYRGKNILLVSHEYPIWMLTHAAEAWDEKRAIREKISRGQDFIGVAETRELTLKIVPRDGTGVIDLHKPYADGIHIACPQCGARTGRVKEVADVWFDSGSMPFAQQHYPFENEDAIDKSRAYPADYISEAMDQTRGWFYTLLAVATSLGYPAPYKNVVSLGLINDKHGQKMSKSKGNIVDPWEVINKYGVDAVRWYFYTVNPPGETKNFDENEISKTYRRMHMLLWNSLVFYKTYASEKSSGDKIPSSTNVLDKWILSRLGETVADTTKHLDKYEIREAALVIEKLVDDLSRWYIRRSRRRLQKPESAKDFDSACATLGLVLRETAKLTAPFAPFFSELLYGELNGTQESVHLEDWPETKPKLKTQNSKLLEGMAEVRRLASLGLAKRAEAGIKVRQPLGELRVKTGKLKIPKELLGILAEEVNIKKVVFSARFKEEIELDTVVTPELREEGILREIIRAVQELRQKSGLKPKDKMILMAQLPAEVRLAIYKYEKVLKVEVGAEAIEYKKSEKFEAEAETKVNGADSWLAVRKI